MSCSERILRPFVRILARYPQVSLESLERLHGDSRAERIGVIEGHAMIEHWARVTGDATLGLKAGLATCFGENGALDFAMYSASTLREAFELAGRHSHMFRDALVLTLEENNDRVLLRFNHWAWWPRAVGDFTLSAWYNVHVRDRLPSDARATVHFAHAAPVDASEYERTFPNATLVFDAPDYGFVFEAKCMDEPLESSDPALHLEHVEHLARLQRFSSRSFAARVREHLEMQLPRSRPTAARIAKQLGVSRRTLVRRMRAEGTSFQLELEDMRRKLALNLMAQRDSSLRNIHTSLGYAQVQAFYRAFRRWTDQTPSQYRQAISPPYDLSDSGT